MAAVTEISEENLQDMLYMENGVLAPLRGFMGSADYRAVVDDMRLSSGETWTMPITLDVEEETYREALSSGFLVIHFHGRRVASMSVSDGFSVSDSDLQKIFGTDSLKHPGVRKEKERSPLRLGGKIVLEDKRLLFGQLSPAKTKRVFAERGFRTVVGFQTRNAVHRAHEYLQRTALEVCDGLFINPVVGWKKKGDFTEEAVNAAYQALTEEFFPAKRVYYEGLRTQMRYAGPREAIFHAVIRRNLGCTHFIIGRDHAGVGDFYGLYEAHELARKIVARGDLGIELLLLHGPCYCEICEQVVTDKTCCHSREHHVSISGTKIRKALEQGSFPDERLMRPEISRAILAVGKENIFI